MAAEQIGPYRIVRLIGEGGMGAVYEALHTTIERRVALKVLHPAYARHPAAVQRFFNEARAVNRIEHPNIVQISEFGQTEDGMAYLVMEFLRGETLGGRLEALVAQGERLRPAEAIQVAAQLADALLAAHDKGIVHRDLKPANVMLLSDGLAGGGVRVKLLDFGIAKLTQGQGAGGKATTANAVMGTPQYMSPEQCRGAGGVDDRTDVYALGVMLYEMLAGRPPFLAEDALGYLGQHVYQAPPPLLDFAPRTPADLAELVHKLLIKDKSKRPAMGEVRAALLAQLSGGAPVVALSDGPVPGNAREPATGARSTLGDLLGQTVRSQPRRRKALLAVALLGSLGAAGLVLRTFSTGAMAPARPTATGSGPVSLPSPAPTTPLASTTTVAPPPPGPPQAFVPQSAALPPREPAPPQRELATQKSRAAAPRRTEAGPLETLPTRRSAPVPGAQSSPVAAPAAPKRSSPPPSPLPRRPTQFVD